MEYIEVNFTNQVVGDATPAQKIHHATTRKPTHLATNLIAGFLGDRIFFMVDGVLTENIKIDKDIYHATVKFDKDLKKLTSQ